MLKRLLLFSTLFYTLTLPFYEYFPRIFGLSIRTYVLAAILIATLLTSKKYNEIDILLGLFLVIAFGSLLFSDFIVKSSLNVLINNILLFVIIRHNVSNKKDARMTLLVYAASTLILGAVALNMNSFIENRFRPFSIDPNEFGISIGVSLIVLIGIAWNSNPARKALLVASSFFAAFFGYLTYSRTMVIAIAGAIFYSLRNNKYKWTLLAIAGLLIIILSPFYGKTLAGRITELASPEGSLNQRTLLLSNAINLIPSYGVFGTGLFQSRPLISKSTPLYETYPGDNRLSHNMYLTIWLELGIIGIALFIAILSIAYKTNDELLKTLLVFAMIAGLLYEMELHTSFWIILALCIATLKNPAKGERI